MTQWLSLSPSDPESLEQVRGSGSVRLSGRPDHRVTVKRDASTALIEEPPRNRGKVVGPLVESQGVELLLTSSGLGRFILFQRWDV